MKKKSDMKKKINIKEKAKQFIKRNREEYRKESELMETTPGNREED